MLSDVAASRLGDKIFEDIKIAPISSNAIKNTERQLDRATRIVNSIEAAGGRPSAGRLNAVEQLKGKLATQHLVNYGASNAVAGATGNTLQSINNNINASITGSNVPNSPMRPSADNLTLDKVLKVPLPTIKQ